MHIVPSNVIDELKSKEHGVVDPRPDYISSNTKCLCDRSACMHEISILMIRFETVPNQAQNF